MKLLKFIILSIFIVTGLFAEKIKINENTHGIKILPQASIYLDKSMKLKFKEIREKTFEKNAKPALAYGYSPDFIVWIKFTLKNTSNKTIRKIIDSDNPVAFVANLYDEKGNVLYDGMANIAQKRRTINPSFEIELKPFESKTFYFESSTVVNALAVNLNLFNIDEYLLDDLKYQIALSLFFGAMIILGLYNLFLFFFTKDISYLYYTLYVFSIAFHQFIFLGYGQLHIFSSDVSKFIVYWGVTQVTFPFIFSILFTKKLLNTENYPKLNKLLNIFLYLLSAVSLLCYKNLILDVNLILFIIFPLLFVLIFTGFLALKNKHPLAKLYLIGWFAVLSSWFFMGIPILGLFNIFEYLPYYVEIALVFEGVIFSIALAKRINILKEKNQELDKKLFLQQKNEKEKLEIEVENKTKDLKEALLQKESLLNEKELLMQELHHRVKNNMQMILSLIRLQTNRAKDLNVKDFFTTAINRISAISNLHELLYKQNKITNINAKEYFTSLIEGLKNISNDKNISINYDINTDLNSNDAIYCGLIINELVSNSIKYAFKKNGIINISLKKENSKYILKVEDDGKGYKKVENKNSLGLLLINTLVENQLQGEILTNSHYGTKNSVIWESTNE